MEDESLCRLCAGAYPLDEFRLRRDGRRRDWRCRRCLARLQRERRVRRRANALDGAVVLGVRYRHRVTALEYLASLLVRCFGGGEAFVRQFYERYESASPAKRVRYEKFVFGFMLAAGAKEQERGRVHDAPPAGW